MAGDDARMQADIATYGLHVIEVFEDDEGPGSPSPSASTSDSSIPS